MKTFTTLKLTIATLGMTSLACGAMLGQTSSKPMVSKFPAELACVFNDDILNALPPNLNDALPAEILELFRKVKFEDINTGEKYVAFLKKVLPYVEKHKVKTKVTVLDEQGKPIEGASAWLVEIRGADKSQEFYMIPDSYVPYKIKRKTRENGSCIFEDISTFDEIGLSYWLFAEEKLAIPPNFCLTVKAQGYETTTKEFLNWDKKTLAFATHLMALTLRIRSTLPAEELKKGKFPKLAKKLTIPKENLGDVIEIKVILKKGESKIANADFSDMAADTEKTKVSTPEKTTVVPTSLEGAVSAYKNRKLYYLPSDISQTLPKEILDILKNSDNIKFDRNEELTEIGVKLEIWAARHVMSAKVAVFDEAGRPVENARLVLRQIRNFYTGLYSNKLNNPMEFKSVSDKTGNSTFAKIPRFHSFSLTESLLVDGKLPEPTLRLTIEKDGFETKTLEFLNVNKTALALATRTNPIIRRFYSVKGSRKIIKYPEPFRNPIIPQENLHEDIILKIVLKKTRKEPTAQPMPLKK
jgi:protocatechuate 3,4-dioxygenase beta subunit